MTYMFIIYFCKKDMAMVKECPKSLMETEKASKRLQCGVDKNGDNQYICVPNEEKTSLVEFCYDGTMGVNKKGVCCNNLTFNHRNVIMFNLRTRYFKF